MTAFHRYRVRIFPALGLTVALSGLAGCQENKIVARVKDTSITQQALYDRVLRVTAAAIPQQQGMDAGGATLISMIREAMVAQMAKEKNAIPKEEDVSKFIAYLKRVNPTTTDEINAGRLTDEDLRRSVLLAMEEFGIGTNGAKAEEKELDASYNEQKPQLKIGEMYTVKTMRLPTEATAQQAIDELKKTNDFRAVATKVLGITGPELINAGREMTVQADRLPPDMKAAFASVAPGQYTPKPIAAQVPNPQTQVAETQYIVAQVVRKTPEYTPSKEEIRPVLEQAVLGKKFPEWQSVKDQQLAEFTKKAIADNEIQIDIKRYQPLLKGFILAQAEARLSQTMRPASGGAVPDGSAPAPGGAPPPSSGSQPNAAPGGSPNASGSTAPSGSGK